MTTTDPFCQRNEIQAGLPLGTAPGSTIGAEGCLVCSAAHLLAGLARGTSYTPYELNRLLVQLNGYENGNRLRYAALEALGPVRFREVRDYRARSFPVEDAALLRQCMENGGGVLVEVNFDPIHHPHDQQPHWLHLFELGGVELGEYGRGWAYDPWWGEPVDLIRYSLYDQDLDYAIWRVALFDYLRRLHVNTPPRIAKEQAVAILAGTPMAAESGDIYDLCLGSGVDPTYALAVPKKETNWGRAGVGEAPQRNAYALRDHGWGVGRDGPGGFSYYDSYLDAARDWLSLLTGTNGAPHYYFPRGYTTIEAITWIYAPPSENGTPEYSHQVRAMVEGWAGGKI